MNNDFSIVSASLSDNPDRITGKHFMSLSNGTSNDAIYSDYDIDLIISKGKQILRISRQ